MQLSLSTYVSWASQAANLPPEPRVSVCKRVSVYTGPLRGISGCLGSFYLTLTIRTPLILCRDRDGRSFRGTSAATITLRDQLPCMDAWPARFMAWPLLLALMWPFLYIFSYMWYTSLVLGESPSYLFYNLIVILMRSWEEANPVFT